MYGSDRACGDEFVLSVDVKRDEREWECVPEILLKRSSADKTATYVLDGKPQEVLVSKEITVNCNSNQWTYRSFVKKKPNNYGFTRHFIFGSSGNNS